MSDDVDFDPEKDATNRAKHGLSLAVFPDYDPDPLILVDNRFDYGEVRYLSIGRVNGRGVVATFTMRNGRIRMISHRYAREKEMNRYGR